MLSRHALHERYVLFYRSEIRREKLKERKERKRDRDCWLGRGPGVFC